jgi:hypothetical protein
MKIKNKYIAILATFMLSIGIYSCRKELTAIPEMKPEAQWAKSYFNDVLLPNVGNQVSYVIANKVSSTERTGSKPNLKTPIWARAFVDKTSLYEFVEIPLKYTRKITSTIGKKDSPADMEIIKASFDRLIIYKDKNGKIDQRIISFIPDKDYLKRHNGDISHNNINKLDKDFNGYLIYKTWDDKTVNRLRIANGKAISLTKSKVSQPTLKLNKLASIDRPTSDRPGTEGEFGCSDYYDVVYETACYFIGDDPIPTHCDEPIVISAIWAFTICPDDPPTGLGGCEDPVNFNNPECQGGNGNEDNDNNACANLTEALNSIVRSGDSFETCLTAIEGSLTYSSASAFKGAMDSESQEFETISDTDSAKVIRFRTWTILASGEDIFVNLIKNASGKWEISTVTSTSARNTLSISWTQNTYSVNTNYNIIKLDLYGTRNWNIILESIGTIYGQAVHYRMNIDNVTGAAVSITKIYN